ncbi:MAG: hypothetical protein M0T77_01830 [Actinomycetota bacterium]|nr:hypothetical protein [Actinomycetota bacterium]
MDIMRRPSGRWQVRWREQGSRRARTFDRKKDAQDYMAWLRRRQQLGQAAVPQDLPLREFIETYWRLHATPNLAATTRALYAHVWEKHISERLGDYGVREITPRLIVRFRADLEEAKVPAPTVIKAMTIVQSILTFAIREELVEYNAAAAVKKPRYDRTREPYIFTPDDVERMRTMVALRDATLISVLAYSGPRPEEAVRRLAWGDIGEQAIRYIDTKRHHVRYTPILSPLAGDLKEWFVASGQPGPHEPVFPAENGDFWDADDWRNWRKRIWLGEPERIKKGRAKTAPARPGCAPAGTRPRDLRSSFITLRIYEGIPLTQIGREVGTSVRMIELHYAGVLANWNGKRVPSERLIRTARAKSGRGMDAEHSRRASGG